MSIDRNKLAQAVRAYQSLNEEEQQALLVIIRNHQGAERTRKTAAINESLRNFSVVMGPSSGGCPRCGYPN